MRLANMIVAALLLCSNVLLCTATHTFHLSFTQIEYHAQTKTMNITMRVFADDLETALSQHSGKSIKLTHHNAARLAAAYLRKTLEFKGRNGQVKRLMRVGLESKADVVFLRFKVRMPDGMVGAQVRQRVFFELFEDQVNQVLLTSGSAKASLEFKHGDDFKMLSLAAK